MASLEAAVVLSSPGSMTLPDWFSTYAYASLFCSA